MMIACVLTQRDAFKNIVTQLLLSYLVADLGEPIGDHDMY